MALKIGDTEAITKHMLKTIIEKCNEEAVKLSSTIPFSDKTARIQYYTGLSQDLIEKIDSGLPERPNLTFSSRISILSTVQNLYELSQPQTYETIFETCPSVIKNECEEPIAYNEFVEEMEKIGYVLKKNGKEEIKTESMIVVEEPEVRFERFMYLHKLRRIRGDTVEKPQIVYIDERVVDLTNKFRKPTLADYRTTSNFSEKSIFYHAVSSKGFITGMFVQQPDFEKWVINVLLSHLKSSSVVIMDTKHGLPEDVDSITKYHSKTEMLRWLVSNNKPFCMDQSKPELFAQIKMYKENRKEHHVDRILNAYGHQVLRLPHQFHDLSITTSLWNILENEEMDFKSLRDKETELMTKIHSLPETTWREFETQLVKIEAFIFDIVKKIENSCD